MKADSTGGLAHFSGAHLSVPLMGLLLDSLTCGERGTGQLASLTRSWARRARLPVGPSPAARFPSGRGGRPFATTIRTESAKDK